MRSLVLLFCIGAGLGNAQNADEKAVTATVQKLFDAMAAHDSGAARAVLLPEGLMLASPGEGPLHSSTQEQFAARIGGLKDALLERMWNPKVLVQGRIAHVWAEYDFWRNGKFGHCGIDSFSLLKTADGWKIAGTSYTIQTSGCAPSPLGPPPSSQQ